MTDFHLEPAMRRYIVKFIAIILWGSLFICNQAKAEDACASKEMLKAHSGHYARKVFWEYLLKNKNWSASVKKFFDKSVSAINIDNEGNVTMWLNWWEAANSSCTQFRDNELWIGDDGPFIHVGQPSQDDADIYAERIFGKGCYQSNVGEKWCFTPNSISVNSNLHKARLILSAEHGAPGTPSYGTPLQMDGEEEKLWVFVPTGGGWKVFQDTFDDVPSYKKIDPNKVPAWRELKPMLHDR